MVFVINSIVASPRERALYKLRRRRCRHHQEDTFTNHPRHPKKHESKGTASKIVRLSSGSRQVLVLRRGILVLFLEEPVHLLDHPPEASVGRGSASPWAIIEGVVFSLHKFGQMVPQ